MKDFDYYRYRADEVLPSLSEKKRELIYDIDQQRLTAEERRVALADAPIKARAWFNEAIKPYREAERKLQEEFWADCREDLGYDKFLGPKGVAALEGKAWEDGHAHGFYDVYNHLSELCDLVVVLFSDHKK